MVRNLRKQVCMCLFVHQYVIELTDVDLVKMLGNLGICVSFLFILIFHFMPT